MPRTSRSPARPGCDLSQPAGPARPPACSVRIMPRQPAARVPADLPPERHTAAGRSGGVLEWTFCAPARGAKRPTRGGIAALFAALGHYGSPTVGWLRRQPLDHPAADSPPVTDPVVQAVRRFLPELDAGGQHPEAAPALRTGTSAPPGWRRSMSWTCISRTARLATTRLWREAAALRRTEGARVLQYSSASSDRARSASHEVAHATHQPVLPRAQVAIYHSLLPRARPRPAPRALCPATGRAYPPKCYTPGWA